MIFGGMLALVDEPGVTNNCKSKCLNKTYMLFLSKQYQAGVSDFAVLASEPVNYNLEIKESLFIP